MDTREDLLVCKFNKMQVIRCNWHYVKSATSLLKDLSLASLEGDALLSEGRLEAGLHNDINLTT